jgi:signal transduction histidine kinase
METLLQRRSLIQRAHWLVKLRWIAIAGLVAGTLFASKVMKIELPTLHLYITTVVIAFYNFILFDLLKYFTWGQRNPSQSSVNRIIVFQISVDLFILTIILHFSGGIENPFFLFFVFHMILASVLLSAIQSYIQATIAVFLFGLLIILECDGVIYHYKLAGFISHSDYMDWPYVLGTFFVFTITLYLVVYMTTSIAKQLRKQQDSFEQANLLLQQNDRLKNEYVMRLTHDIRGHLAAIESCLEIVYEKIAGPLNEKQLDLVERAKHRAAKCMAFISSLLKLTRMKLTGHLDMDYFSFRNCVFNAMAAVERRTTKKSIEVSYSIDSSIDEIYGESTLIEEAMSNLLFNAARYTPEKGKIDIIAKDEGVKVLVQVRDTGIGIPLGQEEKIFEEFYRADNARETERDGTGLGLAIARQVIERHGGKIWAEKNEPIGSIFSFYIPKNKQ